MQRGPELIPILSVQTVLVRQSRPSAYVGAGSLSAIKKPGLLMILDNGISQR